MIIEQFDLKPRDDISCYVLWTSAAEGNISWIFVNGYHVLGPLFLEGTERKTRIPFPMTETLSIEIHEHALSDILVDPTRVPPNIRPYIHWNASPSPDVKKYHLYHQEFGGEEKLLDEYPARPGQARYQVECPIDLNGEGGVWHFFRVEAVDYFGNESLRHAWVFYAMSPPAPPRLEVEDGSVPGTYTFRIA